MTLCYTKYIYFIMLVCLIYASIYSIQYSQNSVLRVNTTIFGAGDVVKYSSENWGVIQAIFAHCKTASRTAKRSARGISLRWWSQQQCWSSGAPFWVEVS